MNRVVPAALLVLTVFVLLWTRQPIHYVGPSDAANYLAAARSGHVLYDLRPYVIHPPAYPLAIRAVSLLTGREESGALLLGLLSNAALVLVAFALGRELSGGKVTGPLAGALILVFSRGLAYTAQGIFREPFQVLLVHLVVLALVRGSARLAVFSFPAALTWDPIGVAAPVFLASGVVARHRRTGVLVALVVAVTWLGWAGWRYRLLSSGPTYPAGIDGMVEDTTHITPGAFVNPNFFPETKRHNAYSWPRKLTPVHLLQQVGPNLLAEDVLYADYVTETGKDALFLALGGAVVALAFVGAASADPRKLVAWALPVVFLGAPGLLGNTGRYTMSLVPLVCILAGIGLERLLGKKLEEAKLEERPWVLLVLALLPAAATPFLRPVPMLGRRDVFAERSVAKVVSALPPGSKIAAYVGWPPALCWLLPKERVVALPFRKERLDSFLAEEKPDVLVVPVGEQPVEFEAGDPAERDLATGLPVLREISKRVREGSLAFLGVTFEAEDSDRPWLHAYVVLGCNAKLRPFGFRLEPGEAHDAARALGPGGTFEPAALALLEEHRAELARSKDPGERELAGKLH